ncbi:MAG TPA: MFS transporter [Acetobacteraceae bacterium]|jgi:MFS family permease
MQTPTTFAQTRTILIGTALMMSLSMGMRQSLGLFVTPMTHDLGLTTADFTFAVAMQNIVWGLSQAPIGAFADRYGMRPAMLTGAALYVLALGIMSAAGGTIAPMPALTISGALLGIALSCTASSLAMTACARAVPEERRSTMLGVVSAFGSLGTLMIAPAVEGLLGHWNWHVGLGFFLMLSAVMLPAAFFSGGADKLPRRGSNQATMREVLGQAVRHRAYLVMSGAYFVCGLQLIFLTTHLPTYLAICGQSPMLSAEALATIGGVNCIGSWFAGWLGNRFPKYQLLGLIYILRSIVLTAYFIAPPTATTTLIFAATMGMLWLGVIPLTSGFVAELFGTRYMATLLGISFVTHQVGSFLGAWGGGLIYDATGSYDRAWQTGVAIGLVAGVVQIVAGAPPRPRDTVPAAVFAAE